VLAAEGQLSAAEDMLRDVVQRAEAHQRPQLVAEATRDLSAVLRRGAALRGQMAARMAKAAFTRIGAEGEVRSLARQGWEEDFAAELRGSLAPLHARRSWPTRGAMRRW